MFIHHTIPSVVLVVTAFATLKQDSLVHAFNARNDSQHLLGTIPGLAGYELVTTIRHGDFYSPFEAALVLRGAWNEAYRHANQPARESLFAAMRSTITLRSPRTDFEFTPDRDATERISFGQAINVIDEVYRRLRASTEQISSAYFAIQRLGSTQKIASGRVVGAESIAEGEITWRLGHRTYNWIELSAGLGRTRDELFGHISGLAYLPFPVAHHIQVAPDKPPMLVTITLLPTTPARDVLIQNIRRLFDWTLSLVRSDTPRALDGLEIESKQFFPGSVLTPIARLEVMPMSSSSGSSSGAGASSESRHGDVNVEMK